MLGQGVLGYYALGELTDSATAYSIEAATGALTLTGNDVAFGVARAVVASSATFTLTGNSATAKPARYVVSEAGSFTLTGNDAGITATRILYANTYQTAGSVGFGALGEFALGQMEKDEAVSFVLTFGPAILAASRLPLTAETGVFQISGPDTGLVKFLGLRAGSSAITVTFNDATLKAGRVLIAGTGAITLGSTVIDFTRASRGLRIRPGGGASRMQASSGGGSNRLRVRA